MSGVADMNPLRQALFNFAYKYKLRHKKKNMPTPLLDRFLFNKTKMLLGGKLRVLTETTAGATLQDMFDNRVGNIGTVLDR
jgi:long-chain acyl-CoA synthetase